MKARVKFYHSLFDACDDKDSMICTVYGDSRKDLINSIYAITDKYVVTNVFIDDGTAKKEEPKA